jgi:hypothetical protein
MDKEKRSFEDDGRTVADMSAVGSPYTGLHMNRNRRTETDRLKAGEGETFRRTEPNEGRSSAAR